MDICKKVQANGNPEIPQHQRIYPMTFKVFQDEQNH